LGHQELHRDGFCCNPSSAVAISDRSVGNVRPEKQPFPLFEFFDSSVSASHSA